MMRYLLAVLMMCVFVEQQIHKQQSLPLLRLIFLLNCMLQTNPAYFPEI